VEPATRYRVEDRSYIDRRVEAIDEVLLEVPVRSVLRDPAARVTGWRRERIAYDFLNPSSGGLLRHREWCVRELPAAPVEQLLDVAGGVGCGGLPLDEGRVKSVVRACRRPPMVSERSSVAESTTARVLGPGDGKAGQLGSIGVRFMIDGAETGGGFSLVEHPLPPRALAAPLHRHSREDEYSFVLDGRVGALLGDEVVYGEPGDLIFKPRGQWHTFWNAGAEPARILEMISPAGFEHYFQEMIDVIARAGPPDSHALAALAARYALEVDLDSIPRLTEEYGLHFGAAP
jgi:mannose-6-phosphate isomerase-like protein (cupin superfamily)